MTADRENNKSAVAVTAPAVRHTLSGGQTDVANMIVGSEFPTMGITLLMRQVFLIMGMFMDWVDIALLVMPVFLPIKTQLPVTKIGLFGTLDPKHVVAEFEVGDVAPNFYPV